MMNWESFMKGMGSSESRKRSREGDDDNSLRRTYLRLPTDHSDINFEPAVETPYNCFVKQEFSNLGLSSDLVKGLSEGAGYSHPSRIQALTLPIILSSKNLVAQGHSGSGKTACFILGMLSHADPNVKALQSLCICPTIELVNQTFEMLIKIAKFTSFTYEVVIPSDGKEFHDDVDDDVDDDAEEESWEVDVPRLYEVVKSHVVIGTPSAVLSRIRARKMDTRDLKVLVYDEADSLLGLKDRYQQDSIDIWKSIRKSGVICQLLLFGTSFDHYSIASVVDVAQSLQLTRLQISDKELFPANVRHYKVNVGNNNMKMFFIKSFLLKSWKKKKVIIYASSRTSVDELVTALRVEKWSVAVARSLQSAELLEKNSKDDVSSFRKGPTQVLVTTDTVTRGLDVTDVNLVVNFDMPTTYDRAAFILDHPKSHGPVKDEYLLPDFELYLHRAGRAGRFGRKGAVFNLACYGWESILIDKMERHFKFPFTQVPCYSTEVVERALDDAGISKTSN